MKHFGLILLCITFMMACNHTTQNAENEVQKQAGEFDWLLGNWQRVNETDGKETFENWLANADGSYVGKGFTMFAEDTVWQEDMHLLKNGDFWQLEIIAPEDLSPTIFKMKNHDSLWFVCENPELDFPKTIRYQSVNDSLHASVSNEEMEIVFKFLKQ